MNITTIGRALLAVFLGLLWIAVASPAYADAEDYEFQLVKSELRKGDGVIVDVRLIHKKTQKTVKDAVIFAKRIDMAPDGMAMMDSPLEAQPSPEAGVYRFKTNLTMEGRWQLSLGAKVEGESGTVASRLILKALP